MIQTGGLATHGGSPTDRIPSTIASTTSSRLTHSPGHSTSCPPFHSPASSFRLTFIDYASPQTPRVILEESSSTDNGTNGALPTTAADPARNPVNKLGERFEKAFQTDEEAAGNGIKVRGWGGTEAESLAPALWWL